MNRDVKSKLNIKVNIEGIELPLTVNGSEEEKVYRDAALLIQKRLQTLRERYPKLPDEKYYYAMVMLYTGVDAVNAASSASTEPYVQMIDDLMGEFALLDEKKK